MHKNQLEYLYSSPKFKNLPKMTSNFARFVI